MRGRVDTEIKRRGRTTAADRGKELIPGICPSLFAILDSQNPAEV